MKDLFLSARRTFYSHRFIRKILFLVLISISKYSFGQFAIISDRDGYINVRKGASKDNAIVDKLKNGHLIYCLEVKGHWTNIDYSKNNNDLTGYIYYDRCALISKYPTIPVLTRSENMLRLAKDSIEIIVTQKQFEKSKHKFKYNKEANSEIELIDNKVYFGKDGEMPETEYQSIKIKLGQKTIDLPKTSLESLYQPNLFITVANYDTENDIIYIQSENSDGAGSYEVIWKVEKGVYKERYIAYGF
jgi:hypothetical protein